MEQRNRLREIRFIRREGSNKTILVFVEDVEEEGDEEEDETFAGG